MTIDIKSMKWTFLFSILLGLAISGIISNPLRGMWEAYYDERNPVVVMQGVLVSQDETSATIHVFGEKLVTCQYLQMNAYTVKNSILTDAFKERVDGGGKPEDGSTKPKGEYDLGLWRIWPKGDADSVMMYVQHACGSGKITITKIAEVALKMPLDFLLNRTYAN